MNRRKESVKSIDLFLIEYLHANVQVGEFWLADLADSYGEKFEFITNLFSDTLICLTGFEWCSLGYFVSTTEKKNICLKVKHSKGKETILLKGPVDSLSHLSRDEK